MSMSVRIRLSVMMFLQFMVWGAWNITLGAYLGHLGFSGVEIGGIFGAFFLACLISPFIGGQLVDRLMPTQIFLAIVHLIGGVLLIVLAGITEYSSMWWVMLIYSLLYAPTLGLVNSISFHHIENTERDFGTIRAWGTLGWIVAGLFLSFWWSKIQPFPMKWDEITDAAVKTQYLNIESMLFTIAGYVSLLYGLFCFALPHTPPAKESASPWAFIDALKLLKDPNFAIFMLIAFVVSTELMFFYILTPGFLAEIGISSSYVPAFITIFAQGAEMLTLLLLMPYLLPRLGVRKTLAVGVLAWPIRYAVFSLGYPWWLVVASLTLHGICYIFFFIVAQIYVDKVAPKHIRASAQSLLTIITFGLGLTLGSWFVGWIQDLFTIDGVINYRSLFLVPCFLTVACAFAFLFFFKEPEAKAEEETIQS